jgi:hypothetical protein
MALVTINELKDVFSGLSSIYLKKDGFSGTISALQFDWQMPVTVDSLSFSQAEPTLNRTKVHGLQADWAVTATAGDVTFTATVPTMAEVVVDWFLGGSTGTVSAAPLNGDNSTAYSGKAYALKQVKRYASIGLLSEDGMKLLIIKRVALYATPVFENGSTTPYAFQLTGSIEATDDASQEDMLFLEKD